MPPMLDIAFQKLARGRCQYVAARQTGIEVHERQRILQLIPKSKSPAGLIQRRASPESATERLIGEPLIEQEIHRKLRRMHLNDAELSLPPMTRCGKRPIHLFGRLVTADDSTGLLGRIRLSKQEHHIGLAAGL